MNQISQALSSGFDASEILNHVLRKFPQLSRQVRLALKSGYSAQQILTHLDKGRKGLADESALTEHEKTRKSDEKNQQKALKTLGKTALAGATAAATGYGAYQALKASRAIIPEVLPAIRGTLEQKEGAEVDVTPRRKLLPNHQKQIGFEGGQQPSVEQPSPQPQTPQSQQPVEPQPINPQVVNPVQNQPSNRIDAKLFENWLEGNKVKKSVDVMMKGGDNPPSVIEGALRFTLGNKKIAEMERYFKKPFQEIVEDYVSQKPAQETATNSFEENSEPESPVYSKQSDVNKMVALPDGKIGTLQGVNKGIAKVDIDGKVRHRKESEIIESPLPAKELHDLFDELIEKIESETGQQVSRMVEWAGYDPDYNELSFTPHLGDLYIYDNISQKQVEKLTSILSRRKSTGKNFIGGWEAGTNSPIGAAMHSLIEELKSERRIKGEREYKRKFKKIYDAIEPAKLASKENYAKKRKEARKAKKSRPR